MPNISLPILFAIGVTAATIGATGAKAQTDDTLLTVVDARNGTEVTFDRAELEAMPQKSYRTSTIWTEGIREFSGVALAEVMIRSGISGKTLQLEASNDYSATIPMDEIGPDAPMIAMAMDGVALTLRDKGPLWLVYPYDLSPDYQTEMMYTRSVWQLIRIEVRP
jgi:hypothetical protein